MSENQERVDVVVHGVHGLLCQRETKESVRHRVAWLAVKASWLGRSATLWILQAESSSIATDDSGKRKKWMSIAYLESCSLLMVLIHFVKGDRGLAAE